MQMAFPVAEYADVIALGNDVGDVLQGKASVIPA